MNTKKSEDQTSSAQIKNQNDDKSEKKSKTEEEFGGYKANGLPEPTRYNDWEVKGRCSDF